VTEPHPASAEDSSTASTVPRTWPEETSRCFDASPARHPFHPRQKYPQSTPAAMTAPSPPGPHQQGDRAPRLPAGAAAPLRSRPRRRSRSGLPSLPITRWHGTMTEIGLDPFGQADRARRRPSRLPQRQRDIRRSWAGAGRTGSWSARSTRPSGTGSRLGASGTVNSFSSPAKYASSCASTSPNVLPGLGVRPSPEAGRVPFGVDHPQGRSGACPSPSSSSLPDGGADDMGKGRGASRSGATNGLVIIDPSSSRYAPQVVDGRRNAMAASSSRQRPPRPWRPGP